MPSANGCACRAAAGLAAAALMLATAAVPASSQRTSSAAGPRPVLFWAVNTVTAMLSGWAQGRRAGAPVHRAAIGGLVGGTLMYAGQRLIGTGKPGLRVAGLETVAAGASVTRNIALGSGPLSDLTFVVFPFYIRMRPRGEDRLSVRLSAAALFSAIHAGIGYRTLPDLRESLLTGAPVFAVDGPVLECLSPLCTVRVVGRHQFGAIAHATGGDDCLCHETIHLAQDIRDALLYAVPAGDLLLQHCGAPGRFLSRFIAVDGFLPLMFLNAGINGGRIDPACRGGGGFYECEANALAHSR